MDGLLPSKNREELAMRFVSILVAIAVTFFASIPGMTHQLRKYPIMVGGDADIDACDTWAEVQPLNPKGDGYLSVRIGPMVAAKELARITSGHSVIVCNVSNDGKWAGIVYQASPKGDVGDCGLSSPDIRERHPYDGPCQSGWVAMRYLWLAAG